MKNTAIVASLLLAACASPALAPEPPPRTATAGGESEPTVAVFGVLSAGEPVASGMSASSVPAATDSGADESSSGEPAASDEPVVLLTTIPVPVPQPAVPRARLSAELRAVWTRVEEQVSMHRPAGPRRETLETVQAWANGAFSEWLSARRRELDATRDLLAAVPRETPYERALALALFAYAMEDLGAQIASAPVPAQIAADPELLAIYIRSLNEATAPLGRRAMELYADCQQRLVRLGDDSPWLPWRAYCVQRGQELIEGYGLEGAEPSATEAAPASVP
jgi:hypothetical protein